MDLLARRIQLDDFDSGDWSLTGEASKARDEQQAPGRGRSIFSAVGDTVERVEIIVDHHAAELPVQEPFVRVIKPASTRTVPAHTASFTSCRRVSPALVAPHASPA